MRATNWLRQCYRSDQLALLQRRLALGRVAGQTMEIGDRYRPRVTIRRHGLDLGIEDAHGHRHVARMRGNARLAGADHGKRPGDAADRGATGAGLAFVARHIGVVEIRTACPLQQIAGGGGLVPELPRRSREECPRQNAVVAANTRIGSQCGVPNHGADAEPSVRGRLDLVESQPVHIDQMCRCFDLQLHQIEQIRPARDEFRVVALRPCCGSCRRGCGTLISKGLHARLPATSVMASTMLE